MSKRLEFLVIAFVALVAACYAPPPQIAAVLLGVLSGLSLGGALFWRAARPAEKEPKG